MCGGDDHLALKCPIFSEACRRLHTTGGVHRDQYEFEYGRTVCLHLDALLVPVQIIIAAMLSLGSDLHSQSGYAFLGQSRGEISPIFREVEYGSAGCYSGSAALPAVVQTTVVDDAHAHMDRLKQCMRQMRVSDGSVVWDDFEGMPVASLSTKFRMPDIERYTSNGCPCLHFRLYSTVMRAHGLDESQMITLFPLSLSGAIQ
ncbi:hypothetical protein AAG906_026481 [Vitis piasezkii]